jgi:exosome complex exonuclease DIS3/RRP44
MYALKESNALVEEFMLLANITVSKKMLRHYPTLAVLRRHQPPSREQFLPLLSAAAAVGIRLDISSSKTLADTLDLAVKEDDPYFNKLLRIMSTRCMMPAQYFCSGEIDKSQWHHYGLAAPVYTHFTSPIRRYADVIVHRLLSASIGVISLPAANADRSRQQDLASHMNRRHRAAQHAQRASVNLNTLIYFKNRPSIEIAYVLSVAQDKIVVIVPRFGIEGSLVLDPIASALTGSERVAEGEVSTNVKYDANTHIVRIFKDEGEGDEVLRIGVFERVQISIKVREGRAGSRRLILGLVVDGKDLAEKDGTESEGGGQVMEINEEEEEEEEEEVEWGNKKTSRLEGSEAMDVESPSKRSKIGKEDKIENKGGKQMKSKEVKTEIKNEVKALQGSEEKSNKKTEKKIEKEKRQPLRKK